MLTAEQATAIKNAKMIFKPQPGGQTMFLSSPAYFVLYGGAAGGGKTYALFLETLRHMEVKGFTATTFRRELKQIKATGGLWDESHNIFTHFNAISNSTRLRWTFPNGANEDYEGLELESDVYKHQGDQICLLKFDELTHFSVKQFRYMLSRNRSTCGVPPYVRATCNPDPDSWVREFVEWYLLPSGTPDPARRGIIRWFASGPGDVWLFGDSREYLVSKYGVSPEDCKTYTFIYATLEDNPALLEKSPEYVSSLKLAGEIESAALLSGNWNIRRTGKLFTVRDFCVFTQTPSEYQSKIIVMDTAQKTGEQNDYSVMQCWVHNDRGIYLIDQVRGKYEYPDLEQLAISFAHKHGDCRDVYVEDKVSGTSLVQSLRRKIQKPIIGIPRNKDKYTRAVDAQGYIKTGYVFVNPMLDYYTDYVNEMIAFNAEGDYAHDDQVDCTFDAVDILLAKPRYNAHKEQRETGLKMRKIS